MSAIVNTSSQDNSFVIDAPGRIPVFPEEILQLVFSYLDLGTFDDSSDGKNERLSTLVRISCVSKTFRRVVRPMLYRTLGIEDWHLERRRNLLQTLLEHPGTGKLVQHFASGDWYTRHGHDQRNEPPMPLSGDMKAVLLPCADVIGLPATLAYRLRWELEQGIEDAETAMLMLMMPGLRLLELRCPHGYVHSLVHAVLPHAFLAELIEVSVSSESSYPLFLVDLAPLIQLPTLRSFKGDNVSAHEVSTKVIGRGIPPLKQLHLDSCPLDENSFEAVLHTYPGLESLFWSADANMSYHTRYNKIGVILRSSGLGMKDLHISVGSTDYDHLFPGPSASLGNLRELASLQHLHVTYGGLLGEPSDASLSHLTNILPFSLQTLFIAKVESHELGRSYDMYINIDAASNFDLNILELLQDERYCGLRSVKFERQGAFKFRDEATEAGWKLSAISKLNSLCKQC
ncbi:hypothetical protein LTR27_006660 [Elasticomyces elasticus]|nr:hypothetical protein LTR27_006660 [Elasticomyces elasticus]